MKFKVIFHLDGTGVYYDFREPIHLDSLLAWVLSARIGMLDDLQRDEEPAEIGLPFVKKHIGGSWVYSASALFPDGMQGEGLQYWRKRFRQQFADITTGSPNLVCGVYRDWNTPIPLVLTPRMVAYANGNRKECKKLLKELRYLGKKRSYGFGKIIEIEFQEIEEDYSLVKDGQAMRYLPHQDGIRLVRPRPPYWNRIGRVKCCEIGDKINITT